MVTSTVMFGPVQQLARAEELFHLGRYPESLQILEEFNKDPTFVHLYYKRASALLLSARNAMHMGMDTEAIKHIGLITEKVFDCPSIYAERCIITGIVKRREGRRLWKTGKREDALKSANEAMKEFNLGEAASEGQKDCKRLYFNAILNKNYTQGLILAINGAPKQHYVPLLPDSTIAEAHSRKHMTEDDRDLITGTTIIADLAMGAGLDIEEIANLSNTQKFAVAFKHIFGLKNRSWPEFILSTCRGFPVTCNNSKIINIVDSPGACQDNIAKALILGLRILLQKKEANPDLIVMYATDLYFSARLMERNNTSQATISLIYDMINSIPKHLFELSRYRMHARMLTDLFTSKAGHNFCPALPFHRVKNKYA